MNPFLHPILGRYCPFDVEEEEPESAAPSPMDLHLNIHRQDLPNLVKRLGDALAGTKHWHETLVAEMSPFRIILIRCYSISLGGCLKCDTTTIEFICEHDTVGGLLGEIRHHWGPNGEEKVPTGSTKGMSLVDMPYDRLAQAIDYFSEWRETEWSGI
ncbi:hypothetical protein LTR95_009927 [Oleoguttula sp. CCFEE 5521]